MIYQEPKFLPGGDRYMLIEFGNEMNLELNFLAQGLATAIADARDQGRDRDRTVLRLDSGPLRAGRGDVRRAESRDDAT